MRAILPIPPPPPNAGVQAALPYLEDAKAALSRDIWNATQLEDAISSAEFFITKAKAVSNLAKPYSMQV